GFGKTEVAMRAAFVTVQSQKQVVLLVPTTLLAQQHFDTLRDRFASWPVSIDITSRLRSNAEIEQIKQKCKNGKLDILIGTHKLLSGDLSFKDLGLVIIDEEHRFGVRQKEKLRAMRAEVDVLTLTATPIPRTLNLSLSGIRDLSIIATPPARRLSIKTFVQEKRSQTIREAISRELMRGGQVFFLHNEVKSIYEAADAIQELVPEARIGVGHGQMRSNDLERVMSEFYHRQLNVLVCTTIIETGIDIPNANTIIIERADKFGLAQLHQLRGRVGRSHRQAYAYLLTPGSRSMTADAVKRLEAIEASGELGVGFTLATQDMEIRGAGELLGDDQSGQIESIGFSLYMEMLDRAVDALRSGKVPDQDAPLETVSQEVNLHTPTLIPEDYLPDVHSRLILYKRIAGAKEQQELDALRVEVIDRFGLLPDALKNLFSVTALKLMAQSLGIIRLDLGELKGKLEFSKTTIVEPIRVVNLVQQQSSTYRLDGASILRIDTELPTFDARLDFAHALFDLLAPKQSHAA
ncbi:MAG TPA: transcription-repair coupling factor, partial [Gammaproteobacteria bacterium]|nr:transcription-repair coupling factor [Gammaproteobacteria bacterium]